MTCFFIIVTTFALIKQAWKESHYAKYWVVEDADPYEK